MLSFDKTEEYVFEDGSLGTCETWAEGTKIYLDENGSFHNDPDVPAIVWSSGEVEYWIHGEEIPWFEYGYEDQE